jgi:predicted Zn-dependent protease
VVSSFGLYEDQKLQAFINEKGKQMAAISHRPTLPYSFKILDSPVVNAFAVPGGYVYFTRGIMAHFNNEAEFTGVLGHEIGHVTAKHGARQQTSQILAQIGLIAGMVVSEDFRKYGDIAAQSLGLLFLKFSRDHESESDKLGVEYSTKIGYDAHEMADFFETLKRIGEKSGQGVPTFLSTHPDPADRFNRVHGLASKAQQSVDRGQLKVNRDQYLRMIDGIVYGEDPKQGYVENWVFYHPELKFQFPVPRNWQHQNSPLQFQMASADGKAVILLTLAQGKTLDEAAQSTVQQYQLKVTESRRTTINGNPAMVMVSEQPPQDGQAATPQNTVRITTHLIQYNGLIYAFHGMTYAALYGNYARIFDETAGGFKLLSDQSKINRIPERIRIKPVKKSGTLTDALRSYEMPATRLEELAIINGMKLSDLVTEGMLIKIVAK